MVNWPIIRAADDGDSDDDEEEDDEGDQRRVVMSGAQVFVMVNAFLDSSALSERKSERKP